MSSCWWAAPVTPRTSRRAVAVRAAMLPPGVAAAVAVGLAGLAVAPESPAVAALRALRAPPEPRAQQAQREWTAEPVASALPTLPRPATAWERGPAPRNARGDRAAREGRTCRRTRPIAENATGAALPMTSWRPVRRAGRASSASAARATRSPRATALRFALPALATTTRASPPLVKKPAVVAAEGLRQGVRFPAVAVAGRCMPTVG